MINKINSKKLFAKVIAKKVKTFDKFGDHGLESIIEKTPEDFGELQDGNERSIVIKHNLEYKIRLYNNTEHSKYVENSVTPKNYYKNGGRRKNDNPFYHGKGAGMFTRTEEELKKEIKPFFKKYE